MQEEYNIRNKQAEIKKDETVIMQNRAILRQDWNQRENAWKEELAWREAEWDHHEQLRKEQIFREDKECSDQIEKEEKQRQAQIELAVLNEVNATARQMRVLIQLRLMAAAAEDAADTIPLNLGRQNT